MSHLEQINYLLKLFNKQRLVWCDVNIDTLTMNEASQLLFDKAIKDFNSFKSNLKQYSIINIKQQILKFPNIIVPQIIIEFTMPKNSYLNAYPLTLEVSYKYPTLLMTESNDVQINEMKQDFINKQIILRPRMKCLLYHFNMVNCGSFDKTLFNTDHKNKYNLHFNSVENVFKSIYWILNNPIIPINEMYSIEFIENIWKEHYLSHKNDNCSCNILYSFPCNWTQYTLCKDIKQKNQYTHEIYNHLRQKEINKIISYQKIINVAMNRYEPLHKQLFTKPWNWNQILDEDFLKLFNNAKTNIIARKTFVETFFTHELKERVYSFKLFTDKFCDILYNELNNYEKYKDLPKQRPNSMN
eukprot:187854_1